MKNAPALSSIHRDVSGADPGIVTAEKRAVAPERYAAGGHFNQDELSVVELRAELLEKKGAPLNVETLTKGMDDTEKKAAKGILTRFSERIDLFDVNNSAEARGAYQALVQTRGAEFAGMALAEFKGAYTSTLTFLKEVATHPALNQKAAAELVLNIMDVLSATEHSHVVTAKNELNTALDKMCDPRKPYTGEAADKLLTTLEEIHKETRVPFENFAMHFEDKRIVASGTTTDAQAKADEEKRIQKAILGLSLKRAESFSTALAALDVLTDHNPEIVHRPTIEQSLTSIYADRDKTAAVVNELLTEARSNPQVWIRNPRGITSASHHTEIFTSKQLTQFGEEDRVAKVNVVKMEIHDSVEPVRYGKAVSKTGKKENNPIVMSLTATDITSAKQIHELLSGMIELEGERNQLVTYIPTKDGDRLLVLTAHERGRMLAEVTKTLESFSKGAIRSLGWFAGRSERDYVLEQLHRERIASAVSVTTPDKYSWTESARALSNLEEAAKTRAQELLSGGDEALKLVGKRIVDASIDFRNMCNEQMSVYGSESKMEILAIQRLQIKNLHTKDSDYGDRLAAEKDQLRLEFQCRQYVIKDISADIYHKMHQVSSLKPFAATNPEAKAQMEALLKEVDEMVLNLPRLVEARTAGIQLVGTRTKGGRIIKTAQEGQRVYEETIMPTITWAEAVNSAKAEALADKNLATALSDENKNRIRELRTKVEQQIETELDSLFEQGYPAGSVMEGIQSLLLVKENWELIETPGMEQPIKLLQELELKQDLDPALRKKIVALTENAFKLTRQANVAYVRGKIENGDSFRNEAQGYLNKLNEVYTRERLYTGTLNNTSAALEKIVTTHNSYATARTRVPKELEPIAEPLDTIALDVARDRLDEAQAQNALAEHIGTVVRAKEAMKKVLVDSMAPAAEYVGKRPKEVKQELADEALKDVDTLMADANLQGRAMSVLHRPATKTEREIVVKKDARAQVTDKAQRRITSYMENVLREEGALNGQSIFDTLTHLASIHRLYTGAPRTKRRNASILENVK